VVAFARPKLVVAQLPALGAARWIRGFKAIMQDLPVVVLAAASQREAVLACMRAGARAFVIRPVGARTLLDVMNRSLAGLLTVSDDAAHIILKVHSKKVRRDSTPPLTARENEVMSRILSGTRDKDTSEELGVQTGTIHTHLSAIYRKLNVHCRSSAARRLVAEVLIPNSPLTPQPPALFASDRGRVRMRQGRAVVQLPKSR
jgi:DNA-binding NarL/FixJ family response regulator